MTPKGQYYQLEMPVSFVPFTEYVLECVSLEMNGNGACFVFVFALVGLSLNNIPLLFFKKGILFIYGWAGSLGWLRLSLVVESRGLFVVAVCRLIAVASLLGEHGLSGSWASGVMAHALISCGTQALEHRSVVVPWHVGSSRIRNQTPVSCVGRWTLYHWATRKAQYSFTLDWRGIPYALFIHSFIHTCIRLFHKYVLILNPKECQPWHHGLDTAVSKTDTSLSLGVPCISVGKESAYNAGDLVSIPESGRSPGEGNRNLL